MMSWCVVMVPRAVQVVGESWAMGSLPTVQASAHATNLTPLCCQRQEQRANSQTLATSSTRSLQFHRRRTCPLVRLLPVSSFVLLYLPPPCLPLVPPPLHVCVVPYTASHHRLHGLEPMSSLRLLPSRQLRHVILSACRPSLCHGSSVWNTY